MLHQITLSIAILGVLTACSPTKFSGEGNNAITPQDGLTDASITPNGTPILDGNGNPVLDSAGNPIFDPTGNATINPNGGAILDPITGSPIFDPNGNPIIVPPFNPFGPVVGGPTGVPPFSIPPIGLPPVTVPPITVPPITTPPVEQCPTHVAFASSTWMRGDAVNPGGSSQLEGADRICNNLARAANLCPTKTFKAILSSSDIDASDRISITGSVYNNAPTRQLVVSSQSQFWQKNGWQALITYDENERAIENRFPGSNFRNAIWTGSNDDGSRRRSQTCSNFTSQSGRGGAGSAYERDDVLFDGTFGAPKCDEERKIYCISQ